MSILDSPIPLGDIEDVLAWVDTFKLSRPTRKINRDFSDAVLLAEILSVHYPKLVEMHNYPPRNSHSLKLNNWMTLNRKVLKKLRLNLCLNTMEQLANCAHGVIERVLVMVRDKIRRDEDMNKSLKETEQNTSSGGSYYEACGDDEHVLVVPVKARVNGVLECIQKKVVSHEYYLGLKEELKDAKDSAEMLKQKVEHLDNLIKLKEERIEELQKQLERKQSRRKEIDANLNSIDVPFEPEPPVPDISDLVKVPSRPLSLKSVESNTRIEIEKNVESNPRIEKVKSVEHNLTIEKEITVEFYPRIAKEKSVESNTRINKEESNPRINKEESRIPVPVADIHKQLSKHSIKDVVSKLSDDINIDRIRSDVFKEVEIIDQRVMEGFHDSLDHIDEPPATMFDDKQNNIKGVCI
ncbi:sperm flagellar protein 1-like [Bicyclus anynana]|uniref:Sperm flagellar protein 1-like n=1 Tax=Bicyclus anynana TaxID=110368 RepID=A0A6J1MRB4_BICAN|nr:sperm flagellar protein 1-like [Bicyclus anynana]